MQMSTNANAISARTRAAAPEIARRERAVSLSPLIAPPNKLKPPDTAQPQRQSLPDQQAITHGSLPKVAIERWTWSWEYVGAGWGQTPGRNTINHARHNNKLYEGHE